MIQETANGDVSQPYLSDIRIKDFRKNQPRRIGHLLLMAGQTDTRSVRGIEPSKTEALEQLKPNDQLQNPGTFLRSLPPTGHPQQTHHQWGYLVRPQQESLELHCG